MQKLLLLVISILLPLSFSSYSEPGTPDSFQEFWDWRSFVLRSDQEELARLCSLGNPYELCIDYYKHNAKHLFTMIISKDPPSPPKTEPFAFNGAVQVDSNPVYSGRGMYMEDDANIYMMFGEFSNSFINEMVKGNKLRIISDIHNKVIEYSLKGFAKANTRANMLTETFLTK